MEKEILLLPIQATGRADIGRLLHEGEQIDNFLKQAAIRQPGTAIKMPKVSRLMEEFLITNKLNLLHDADRMRVLNFLASVKVKAPILHMSFGVDPSALFTQKLITWLRAEIHPLVLLQVGLQPNIGAGCIVRSTNKYYDFSLREHFKRERSNLLARLHDSKPAADQPALNKPAETAYSLKEVEYGLTAEQPVPRSEVAKENPSHE